MKMRDGRITRLWVATVHVRSMEKAVHFYRDILGLKVQLDARRYNWVEVGPDEPNAKIGIREASGDDASKRVGAITGIVFDTDDIEALYERLAQTGVEFTRRPTKTPWGGIIADFLDPDGNELEVVQDPSHYAQDFPPAGEHSLRP